MVLLRFLAATASILLTQLVLAAALMGIGLLVRRRFGLRRLDVEDCFLAFWVGFAGMILFLILWNFVLPVGGWALSIVLAAGALGLLRSRRELGSAVGRAGWRPSPVVLLVLLVAGLWIANLGIGPLNNYDSGLYHLQGVLWAEHYRAVPGLANLDGPIAFNNSIFLYDALLSTGPWQGRSNHVANGMLVLVFLLQALVAGARLWTGTLRPGRAVQFLLLGVATSVPLHGRVSSFVTGSAPTLILLVVVSLLYAMLSSAGEERAEDGYRLVVLSILLAIAVTLKTSTAVFAAVCFPLAIVHWLRRRAPQDRGARTLRWAGSAVGVLAVAWMARGVILSGYPLFPLHVAGFPVAWRAPAEHAAAEMAFISHSGRGTTHNVAVVAGVAGWRAWVPTWTSHAVESPFEIAVPLALAILAAVALVAIRPRSSLPLTERTWWIVPPLLIAIVAWFLSAPEPRYARAYFWGLAAVAWCQVVRTRGLLSTPRGLRAVVVAAAIVGISPTLVDPVVSNESPYRRLSPLQAILKTNLNRPGPVVWYQPLEHKAEVSTYTTRSGLVLNVVQNQCWDTPVPCTPNPSPNLRLRDPSNLAKGFVLDGPWQMENWPTGRQPTFLTAWRRSRQGRALHDESLRAGAP